MPLATRLVDEIAGPGLDDVVAEQGAHPALEHEAVLVLAVVAMKRRGEITRRHRMLHEGEAAVGVLPGIMNRTPMLPREPALPSVGPTILGSRSCDDIGMPLFRSNGDCFANMTCSARCVKIWRSTMYGRKSARTE